MRAPAFVFSFLCRLDRVNSDKLIGNAVHDSVMDRLPLVSLVSRVLGAQVAAADFKFRRSYYVLKKHSAERSC